MISKLTIDNPVVMDQILEFEMVFPDEKPLSLQEYLTGVSRDVILNVAATFLGFKSFNSKFRDNKELLTTIFNEENHGFANEIYKRILVIQETGTHVVIINTYSSLKLFEYFFTKDEEHEKQTHSEFERNLFKSYLVLNSEFSKIQYAATTSTKKLVSDLKVPMMMFCMDYPISDKMNYDISQKWATQMMKAIYLFQFLESFEKTKSLLATFLTYFNKHTWQEYLKSFLPFTFPIIKNEKEGHIDISISPGEGFEEACSFIEKLIIQNNDELDENDFLTLRARPFYKIKIGLYRVIFNLFVIEKIFKGVYFLLKKVNDTLPEKEKIVELKSIYGDQFSEKVLLYNVIESIYPKKHLHYSGEQLATMKIDGAPDYYLRIGNDILIFESKDFLIRADKKMSFDFNVYEKEFKKVLYYKEKSNGKEKPKAVMQLINSIRKLLKNEFKADTDYHYKKVFIYESIKEIV